ncbi:MAG: low temperature requirement protein A [Acidimicrobiia bacterium]
MKSLRPPQLRTVQGESERTATWLELFYDLAFVVAVAVLGSRLLTVSDWAGIFSYLGLFFLIWWLWVSHTFYADRYDTDDLVYRLLATVQLVAVAVIAASLSAGPAMSTVAFAAGYTIARVALLVMYWRARFHVPETRDLVSGYLVGFGLGALIWTASVFAPEPARFVLWAVAIFIDLATPWVMRRHQARAPLDVSHLPERFGLFTILVLGESIAATVVGLGHVEWEVESTFTAIMALAIATAIWWLYFDNVEGQVVRRKASTRRTWRPTVWIYSHFGIAAGLGILAVGLEHAISEAGHGAFADFERWLLVGGTSFTVVFVALTHLASGSPETYKLHNAVAYSRMLAAVVVLALGLFDFMSSQALVTAIAAVLITTALSNVRDDS